MDTIPSRVIAVLRREHRRFDKSGKFGQPITWVAAKLAKHPMAIKRMVNELNGRWLSAVVNEHGNLDFCCGGHRSFANSQKCKSGVDGVIQVAFVPLVGFYKQNPVTQAWSLIDNLLVGYPVSEQLKTLKSIRRVA